jgi:hypothetical protein
VPRTTRVTGRTCRRERESLVFVVVFFVILLCVLPLFSISKNESLFELFIHRHKEKDHHAGRDEPRARYDGDDDAR